MCMVRNSIGAKAYTCDEVITSRSGKRIHIYNTDAEGRITMLDPLTRAKDEALHAVNPHVITLATLTGHEILSYGYYASMMDNGWSPLLIFIYPEIFKARLREMDFLLDCSRQEMLSASPLKYPVSTLKTSLSTWLNVLKLTSVRVTRSLLFKPFEDIRHQLPF